MSTDATPPADAPKKSRKTVLIAIVVVLGIALGGGGGFFLAGPLLAGGAPAAPHADSASAEGAATEGGASDDRGARDPKGKPAVLHSVENLVLNPANSGGSRFLLLSVAFAVKDEATAKSMQDRDPELRDVILRHFGTRTVDELVDMAQRDPLKASLRTAVAQRFGGTAVRDVYFPQFVVQ